jgi:putative membrane-bound dehydrogenase-like protein
MFFLLLIECLYVQGAVDLSEFSTNDDVVIECVASEPLVIDPVAMAFDEHRRMWVAENRAYPKVDPNVFNGQIALLEDTDLDGYYEKRTTFATDLAYPNGVLPWEGGIIVTDAPDVLFMKDTDGDGKCDIRQVLLTGFDTKRSTQLRVNDPTLGPDGWIYLAGGLSGGRVKAPWQSDDSIVDMRRHDMRFHPYTWQLKPTTGKSQYGMDFDRSGNRFICMNRVQVQHVMAEDSDWGQNPYFHFNKTVDNLPEERVDDLLKGYNAGARIYPLTEHLTTADSHAGTFTAACAVTIYESNGLPEKYFGHVFSCDPTGNLIHLDYLESSGPGYVAKREDSETEFVASRNPWFRPVFLTTGPDGALYVCDMRRKIIEHPDYLPEEIRKRTDFETGKNLGRIYRIRAKELARVKSTSINHKFKVDHHPLDALIQETFGNNLSDSAIRKWYHSTFSTPPSNQHQFTPNLRYRLARRLMHWNHPQRAKILAMILVNDSQWEWTQAVVLQSSKGISHSLLDELFQFPTDHDGLTEKESKSIPALNGDGILTSIETLSKLAILEGNPPNALINQLLTREIWGELKVLFGSKGVSPLRMRKYFANQRNSENQALLFAAVLLGMDQSNKLPPGDTAKPWQGWGDSDSSGSWQIVKARLSNYPSESLSEEQSSILHRFRVLAGIDNWVWKLHEALDQNDPSLLELVIEASRSSQGHEIFNEVFTDPIWHRLPHNARSQFLQIACSERRHAELLFNAIEEEIIPPGLLNVSIRNQWKRVLTRKQQQRLDDILGQQASPDAAASFQRLQPATVMTGNPGEGKILFMNFCSSCHRLDQEGHALGPDLYGIRNQAKESILLHIVDPNREIASGFEGVEWTTKSDEIYIGLLAFDHGGQLGLKLPSGIDLTFERNEGGTVRNLQLSFMPEGILDGLTTQQAADLLAYLRGE